MCGICGSWNYKTKKPVLPELLRDMTNRMAHRGPDDAGLWYDAAAGIGLGHRRLSIVDLSPLGHQPMASKSGRYQLSYNGEVYNFVALRRELSQLGHTFRGESDTEVILAAIEQWGLEAAVKRFVGMFACALWDNKEHNLYLVRDRLGIKPLYYGWVNQSFIFASELKAFKAHPDFYGEIDRNALALLMRHNYIPAPYCIYQGVYKLPPGTILSISSTDLNSRATPKPYWSARQVAEQGQADPFLGSEDEAVAHLDLLLKEAISLRMIADVPLGAFLSGGIDSSTVVALMQAQSKQPVKTFSIGFSEEGYNEATFAKTIANHLGTEHTELYISPAQAMDVIPQLPTLYDEPFADSSQIPTFLVSQLARQDVTVSLSGDGGDELFAGYNNYLLANAIWKRIAWLPNGLRRSIGKRGASIDAGVYDRWLGGLSPLLSRFGQSGLAGDKLHKLFQLLSSEQPEAMYRQLVSHCKTPTELVIDSYEPPTVLSDAKQWADLPDFVQRMMFFDLSSYLPDDILVKVDRASMGVSLEARVPLLDHRVVEFAWRIPLSMKIRNGQGKWLLRQVLYQYVPKRLVERPKMGFGVPIDAWLRGPLRSWAEELLAESRLKQEGFFNPLPIRQKWVEHLSGQRNWHSYLWNVLIFQAWLENQRATVGTLRGDMS